MAGNAIATLTGEMGEKLINCSEVVGLFAILVARLQTGDMVGDREL